MNRRFPINNTVRCDGCELDHPAIQQEDYPDGGWAVPYDNFGYYGGFTDFNWNGKMPKEWILCHDCVLKILNALPPLKNFIQQGQHNCDAEAPCCDFAWRATDLFGTDADGVKIQYGHNGQWVDEEK